MIRTAFCVVLLALSTLTYAADEQGWVPFELKGGHISIPSKMGHLEGYSLLDTGASMVAINEHIAQALGLKAARNRFVDVTGVAGTERRVVYRKVPVNIFGADLTFKDVTDMSFGGDNMQLLIGGPILQMFLFQFDYPNQRLRALPRKAIDLQAVSNINSKRDSRGNNLPAVEVNLNKQKKLWLTMDTGSNGGLLINRKVAQENGWLDQYEVTPGRVFGVNSSAETETFTLPELQFGPITLEDIQVTVPAKNVRMPAVDSSRSLSEGLLGYDILKHFVLTIDYKKGHVHIGLPE